ncbi:hypothetical protein, partial [Mesorhizobium sp. M1348]|uniref:hypothetical protein n=1 Tax=unclassified Mesorhizobium TaxID=325217 RepID=UPI00333DA507
FGGVYDTLYDPHWVGSVMAASDKPVPKADRQLPAPNATLEVGSARTALGAKTTTLNVVSVARKKGRLPSGSVASCDTD